MAGCTPSPDAPLGCSRARSRCSIREWELEPEGRHPTARGGCAAAALTGRLVVVGGEGNRGDPDGVFHETESYDPATDRWRTDAPMRTARHGIGAAVVGTLLIVPGGATREGFGAVAVNESFEYR